MAFSSLEAPFNMMGRNGDGLRDLKGQTTTLTQSLINDDDTVNIGHNQLWTVDTVTGTGADTTHDDQYHEI
jgi:hypothetical protein